MGGRTRAPYAEAFRAEAVQLVRSGGGAMTQVAKDLGIHHETLRGWVRQTDVDAGRRDGLTSEARAEFARLRREVRILKEEREVLKNVRARRHLLWMQKLRSASIAPPERSGRQLTGASEPVKKHGPGVAADVRVVTPLRRSRVGK